MAPESCAVLYVVRTSTGHDCQYLYAALQRCFALTVTVLCVVDMK